MALNLILCLNGPIGADVLFLVGKVLKLARGLAKEIVVVKICMIVKIVIKLIVLTVGWAGHTGQFALNPVMEVPKFEQENAQKETNAMGETAKRANAIHSLVVILFRSMSVFC